MRRGGSGGWVGISGYDGLSSGVAEALVSRISAPRRLIYVWPCASGCLRLFKLTGRCIKVLRGCVIG